MQDQLDEHKARLASTQQHTAQKNSAYKCTFTNNKQVIVLSQLDRSFEDTAIIIIISKTSHYSKKVW